jgi:hypothetical protein
MRRGQHVRLCEGGGARFPSATQRVINCKSAAEARAALATATRILERLGVRLNPQKTRIVHISRDSIFWDIELCEPAGTARFPAAGFSDGTQKG